MILIHLLSIKVDMSSPDRFLLAGVMGWPVMHSRSPTLHNYLFAHHGLAGTYVPLAIRPADLEAALRALAPLGFSGCNVTIPHKEAVIRKLKISTILLNGLHHNLFVFF